MKKRGEGSIRLRKDGRYEVRYFFQGEPRSQYAKTMEQAEEILKKINAQITLDEHFIPANIKVGDWMNEWLTLYKKKAIKPKTYESYEQIIRCYIVPWLGNISIGRLTSDHIQRMVNDMTQSSRTIKYTITVLKMAMKKAIEKKYIRDMPTIGVELPKQKKKPITTYGKDEAMKFLDAIKGNRYSAAFVMAIMTGMRKGEILALKWQDIDFDAGMIRVDKTLNRVKTFVNGKIVYKTIIDTNKTDKSNRILPILPILYDCLKSHLVRSEIAGHGKPTDFVFCNHKGGNVSPRKFSDYFYKIFKSDDVDISQINFHSLRHTFATLGLESGMDLKVISDLLGHYSTSFTADVYLHPKDEQKRMEVSKLANFLTPTWVKTWVNQSLPTLLSHTAPSGTRTQGPLIKSHNANDANVAKCR